MQRIEFNNRVTVATDDGVKSGIMTFYLDDEGECFVAPKISPEERFPVETDKRWDTAETLHDDIASWRSDRPRDEDGRIVPFPCN